MNVDVIKPRTCSFCDKDEFHVSYIFYSARNNVDICNCCITTLAGLIKEKNTTFKNYTPAELKRAICSKVYGQDDAVELLSVCLFKHIHNISNKDADVKSNLLFIGDTGCGKTYMMRVVYDILGIPVLFVDSTGLTSVGYIGDDMENVILRAYKANDSNIVKTEQCIIFFDEFDKLAVKETANSKDIGGEAVQQEMLRIVEGSRIRVAPKPYFGGKEIEIDTERILFVAGGSFRGLEDKLKQAKFASSNKFFRPAGKNFNEKRDSVIIRRSLIEYGIIPELAGRFSNVCILNKLKKENFLEILNGPESKIKKYTEMLSQYNINVEIADGVYDVIAEYACELSIGARGITYFVDKIFTGVLFSINHSKVKRTVKIDVPYVEKVFGSINEINYC